MPQAESENLVVRLLAWPRWDETSNLDLLMEMSAPLLEHERVGLLLVLDPIRDPPEETAVTALQRAFDRRFPSQVSLDVSIESRPLDHDGRAQLGRITGALVLLGKEPPGFNESTELPMLANVFGVRKGLKAAGFPKREPAPVVASNSDSDSESEPEKLAISVVLCAQAQDERLRGMLDALKAQDLGASQFEVLLIDDGSDDPIADFITVADYPFALSIVRQESSGVGVAWNTAMAYARGEYVVFYDEHSKPGSESLRRHLDAQRRSQNPVAVVGNFAMDESHVQDSFGAALNTHPIMFPQPGMSAGQIYQGRALCAENVSVLADHVRSVGGFELMCSDVGADWELGMRMDRAFDLKVVFDPKNLCSYDGVLDVDTFTQRQYANGRSNAFASYKQQDPSIIMGPDADVPSDEFWEALETQVRESSSEWESLVERIRTIVSEERESGNGPQNAEMMVPMIKRLGYLAFSRGLVEAYLEFTRGPEDG